MNGALLFRRMAALVAGGLLMSLSACTPSKVDLYPKEEDFKELVVSALSVAYPDYEFSPGAIVERIGGGLLVALTAYPVGAFMDESGEFEVSVKYDRDSGVTHVSPLPATRLSRVLKAVGVVEADSRVTRDARELLRHMGKSVEVVAVAELAKPMTEDSVTEKKSGLVQPGGVLLSPNGGRLPFGASLYCGRTCHRKSYVASFREWVATLRPQDKPALRAFGLELDSLRAAAQEGKIYGLVYGGYDPGTLLEISRNPHVKALYVADVRLRCSSEEDGICEPWRE